MVITIKDTVERYYKFDNAYYSRSCLCSRTNIWLFYIRKNDIIDYLFSEFVIQKPYVINAFEYKEKYDYETDKVNTVAIITLNSDYLHMH